MNELTLFCEHIGYRSKSIQSVTDNYQAATWWKKNKMKVRDKVKTDNQLRYWTFLDVKFRYIVTQLSPEYVQG